MQADLDPLKLENQLCFPLYAASRQVIKRYAPLLAPLDLTYTQYIAMMVLWEQETISARDLGRRLYLDSGTLTPLLKSLEGKGCVTRRRDPNDDRVLLVSLTARGRALRERALDVPAKISGCIPMPPEKAAQLYTLLHELLAEV